MLNLPLQKSKRPMLRHNLLLNNNLQVKINQQILMPNQMLMQMLNQLKLMLNLLIPMLVVMPCQQILLQQTPIIMVSMKPSWPLCLKICAEKSLPSSRDNLNQQLPEQDLTWTLSQ